MYHIGDELLQLMSGLLHAESGLQQIYKTIGRAHVAWLVSSMACVYPLFRGRMEAKAMAALGKTLISCLASAWKLTVTSCLS